MADVRVLVSCRQMIDVLDHFVPRFKEADIEVEIAEFDGQAMSENDLLTVIDRYEAVIAGDDAFTRRVLQRGRRLKVVSKWGIGTDSIDQEAAAELGIAVTNTPNMFSAEVGDVTIGYLIMLARGLHLLDTAVRAGHWPKIVGRSLSGATLGVIGLGGIGRATATRALAMGMRVLGSDPSPTARASATAAGVVTTDLDSLLPECDALALNCPLTPDTYHLLDTRAFSATPPGLLLVNTGRGALVRESALVTALDSGQVAGAALDVFEEEPLPADSPLRSLPGVILGSHNASNTREAGLRASAAAVDNVFAYLDTDGRG
jgi:D-3-phosphoglycerate dehydrogenase / 2-oxoglutarate reductase